MPALYYVWLQSLHVMAALVAGIHVFLSHGRVRRGWPEQSPAMTMEMVPFRIRKVL
jgi:hypothetical protein